MAFAVLFSASAVPLLIFVLRVFTRICAALLGWRSCQDRLEAAGLRSVL